MKNIFTFTAVAFATISFAQTGNVGINTPTPNADAALDIVSTNKGLLPPRIALTASNSPAPLASNVAGMVVYNTATAGIVPNNVTPGLYYNNGTIWVPTTGTTPATTVSNTASLAGTNTLSTTVNGVTGTAVAVPNIYTADGTLTANRTVTMGANILKFENGSNNTTFATGGSNSSVTTTGSNVGFFRAFGGTSALDLTATNGGTTQIVSSGSATNLLLGSVNNTPLGFITNTITRASISPSGVFYAGPAGGNNTTLDNTGSTALLTTTSPVNTATIRAVGGNRMLEMISVNGGENQIYSWLGNKFVVGTMDANPMTFMTNSFTRATISPAGDITTSVGGNSTVITNSATNASIVTTSPNSAFVRAIGGTAAVDIAATNGGPTQITSSGSATNLLLGSVNNTPVSFITNGATRATISAAGDITASVGGNSTVITNSVTNASIVTTSPNTAIVRAIGGTAGVDITATNGGPTQISSSGSATNLLLGSVNNTPVSFITNGTTRATISAAGDITASVGGNSTFIGNSGVNSSIITTSSNIAIVRAIGGAGVLDMTVGNGGQNIINSNGVTLFSVGTANVAQFDLKTNNTTRATITAGGNFGIGTTSPTSLLSVNGSADKPGGGSWGTFSDRRVKKDIADFNDGLNVISKLKTVTYKYNEKSGYEDLNKEYVGFIAQDVEKVAPYMVKVIDDTKKSGLADKRELDESALTKILVNAVKELQAEIIALKKEVEMLKK
ncbi:hypothetical protein HHL23_04470 [Chryseobacterium sp. RP-3-3]|uniref:Peptidase S74 domain-containing protein n=1 Tax=Chryseobacterium antibioticum TaxID=2728847 RepID=A0A7Y0FQX5_9FLAO|nr:tail fiber domain-containing protein [Chryseobacterium antibioticum]NML69046.1 hypothetical protein [Chryseobacterium antibioticum]